jgi:hypothetical protein
MMLEREPIHDPNVAAYLVTHGGMRLVIEQPREQQPRRLPGLLAALFGAGAPIPDPEVERPVRADPPLQPGECVRQGHVVFATPDFAARMEIYVRSYRIEAKERLEQAR